MSVNVKYKDTSIAELTETGTKTLKTAGKYCEADIVVENTKDSATLQEKTITENGVYTPDSGYDGLSKVAVNVQSGGTPIVDADLSYSFNNEKIEQFIADVTYTSDYTTSSVSNYTSGSNSGAPNGASTTLNAGTLTLYDNGGECSAAVSAGSNTLYNIAPNHTGAYKVVSSNEVVNCGGISATGNLRVIKLNGVVNARDLGGWACDGGTVKYGLLFRTKELTSATAADVDIIEGLLGVKAELDMRETSEGGGSTPLDTTIVTYLHQPIGNYADAISTTAYKAKTKTAVEFIINCALQGKPCLYHCAAGADRTGTITWLLLGVLGVSQSDCDKEYEITNFSGPTRLRSTYLGALYTAVMALDGDDFTNKCKNALIACGISIAMINHFRHAMINGNPTDLEEDEPFVPQSEIVSNLKACTRMAVQNTSGAWSSSFVGNDNGALILASSTANDYSFADREGGTYYLITVPSWATKCTVTTTDTSIAYYKWLLWQGNAANLTRLDHVPFATGTNILTFNAAENMVIGISPAYSTDGAVKPSWSYDSSKITVTFTNY